MSDSQLLAAARALRVTRTGNSPDAPITEDAILRRAQRSRPASHRTRWLLPIAAVLVMSSAWAASQPAVRRQLSALFTHASPAQPVARERRAPRASISTFAPAPSASMRPGPTGAAEAAPVGKAAPSARRASSADADGAPLPTPSAAALPPPPASPLQLYQRAHALHFREHDCAAALPAWDEYLARAPQDALALEARFNRGVCLSALGRTAEARAALTPFASGSYGGYRQLEAQRALDGVAPDR